MVRETRYWSPNGVARVARVYASCELPAWGALLGVLGVFDDSRWTSAPTVVCRGKWDGAIHELDLRNWSERQTYFLGRFYDLPLQLLLRRMLQSNQRFVDIGANVGMITALASRLVGRDGRVDAFEPNPDAMNKLVNMVSRNTMSNVCVHNVALGSDEGTAVLRVVTEHTGMGTLAELPEEEVRLTSAVHSVRVRRGDDVLTQDPRPISFMKIDVEGYELVVLAGLRTLVQRDRPPVACEVVPDHLRRMGHTPADLFAYFLELGYRAHWICLRRKWGRYRLHLPPAGDGRGTPLSTNVLFWPSGRAEIDCAAGESR